ncbi:MAG TPA: hypothetical protein VJ796_04755 [Acidimicrobiia bacterium]|nr:hypothetical protein [Acidimicrobiia bacterium]
MTSFWTAGTDNVSMNEVELVRAVTEGDVGALCGSFTNNIVLGWSLV